MSFNLETTSAILLKGTHRFAEQVNLQFKNEQYSSNIDIKGNLEDYTNTLYYLTEALQYRLERNLFDDTTTLLTEELQRRLGTYIDLSTIDNNYLPPKGSIVIPVGLFNNTFLLLTDTPKTYVGQAGKVPVVNSYETGLEFDPFPSPPVYTVNNGLLASTSTNFQLGGNLLNSTNIDGVSNSYGLNFSNLSFFQTSASGQSNLHTSTSTLNVNPNFSLTTTSTSGDQAGLQTLVDNSGRAFFWLKSGSSAGIISKNNLNWGQNSGKGMVMYDDQDHVGIYYPTSGIDYTSTAIAFAGDRWIPHVGYVKSLININLPDGPLTGLSMSISGGNVLITAGTWRIVGTTYQTTGTTTLAVDAQDATLSRYDSVYADNTNALHIVSGTLSVSPVAPAIPTGTIKVGDVFITPTSVTVVQAPIANYVTLNTPQTIFGYKTFQNLSTFNNGITVTGGYSSLGQVIIGGGDWYGRLQIRSDYGRGFIDFQNTSTAGYDYSMYNDNTAYPGGPASLIITGNGGGIKITADNIYDSHGVAFLKASGSGLAWASITGTPTTLAGYNITDAVAKAGSTMTGALVITTGTGITPLSITGFSGSLLTVDSSTLTFNGTTTDFKNSGATVTLLHLGDGTQSAISNMPRLQVTSAPSASNDVVRLTDLGSYLALTGGTLSGDVQQPTSPVNTGSLVTKGYVDTAISNSSIYFAAGSLTGLGTNVSPYSPNATNGLTISSGFGIQLGGILTGATSLNLSTYNLTLSGTGFLVLNQDPTSASHAVTKSYVDNLITGVVWTEVSVASTANLTLSGEQTIDGFTTSSSYILVKNQTTQTNNGIYITASGSWTRASEASTGAQLVKAAVLVKNGTVNIGTQWINTNSSITLGTTNITFAQMAGAGTYTNGTGLSLSGNVFSLNLSNANTWAAVQTFGNNISIGGVISTGATGTGNNVFDNTPTLITPILGVATATSINKVAITAPATSATLTIANGATLQQTGAFVLNLTATAASTPTFPTGAGTLPYIGSANTWSALQTFGNNISIGGVTSTGASGTGNNVFSIAPSFTGGISVAGGINLSGSTSGVITIQPQAAAGTYNWNLPITAGTSGYLLTSGGGTSTAMTWTDPTTIAALSSTKWATARNLAGNSVDGSASVAFANKFIVQGTADAGLSAAQFLGALGTGIVKNTTTTGVLSIAVAGTDYQGVISLTTTGTTGAATLTGTTLNIPNYAGTVSSVIGGTGLTGGTITTTGTLAIDQSFAPTWTNKHNFTITNTASSSATTNYGVQIANVVNQTLTGNFTDLQINRTTNTPGSGSQLLLDLQVGGVSKFSINTSGQIQSNAGFNGGSFVSGTFNNTVNTSANMIFLTNYANADATHTSLYSPNQVNNYTVWNTSGTPAVNYINWKQEGRTVSSGSPTISFVWSSSIQATTTPSYTDRMILDGSGVLYVNNVVNRASTLSTLNATGTITAAMIANGVITSTSAAAVTATMDTTANIVTQFTGIRGMNIPFTVDNSVGANIVTVALGTGMTSSSVVTGGTTLTVAAGAVGMFNIYLSSTTTSILTRSN